MPCIYSDLSLHSDVERLSSMDLSSGAKDCPECMSTIEYERLNSNKSDPENLLVTDDDDDRSDQEEDDFDSFSRFSWPEEDDDDWGYFYEDFNEDLFVNTHLNREQLNLLDHLEEENYQRSKRSNKKLGARRQIKIKYAQSIEIKSHNKQLYMHHQSVKKVQLDPPNENCIRFPPFVSLYCPKASRTIPQCPYCQCSYYQEPIKIQNKILRPPPKTQNKNLRPRPKTQNKILPPSAPRPEPSTQYRDYTINESNIPNEPCFDDEMITFLLEMQNRDLSPEDYEMLLRLDERVQRQTVCTNIFDTLPTVQVNEEHLNDQCTICMENYILEQKLKLLPCTHIFHSDCIETYLKEFSTQCPLDNLPLI